VAVYESSAGGWLVFGGTSVAAPIVASIFALTGHAGETPQYPYANASQFYDVSGGSNGTCTPSYLCSGAAGYDGPTGIGSPNGMAMLSGAAPALVSRRTTGDFSLSAGPSVLRLAPGGVATATITVSGGAVNLANFKPPDGLTVTIAPAKLPAGGTATVRIAASADVRPGPLQLVFTGTTLAGVHATNLTVDISR
jgi:hypothetical protein